MREDASMANVSTDLLSVHRELFEIPSQVRQALREAGREDHLLVYAWELARLPKDLDPSTRAQFLTLSLALLVTEGQGNSRMSLTPGERDPGWVFLRACGCEGMDVPALLGDSRIAHLAGTPGEARPLIVEDGWLHLCRLHRAEVRLAQGVKSLVEAHPLPAHAVPEEIFTHPVTLSGEQRAAVELALTRPLALITGGAGTGKTSIVVAVLRSLLHQPGFELSRIALAAPTGKAAQRMGEAIRHALEALGDSGPNEAQLREFLPEPRTLHRLLGWHPALARFRHSEENPLPADVVIVDEASMISLELMERLMGALSSNARLVLLGDADQLPSVEAGCAFRDLVQELPSCVQRLTESYRMRASNPGGRGVLTVANHVNQGEVAELWDGAEAIRRRSHVGELEFQGVELAEAGQAGFSSYFERWFQEVILGDGTYLALANRVYHLTDGQWAEGDLDAIHRIFQHLGRARILCVLKTAGDLRGVEAINGLFHAWMQKLTGHGLRWETPFFAGEPVMMTANDYVRGIFNGDQGVVLKIDLDGELRQAAVFPSLEGPRVFPLEVLRHRLELCHAMTVHKAQGSEFDQVMMVLPKGNHPALSREVVYTGLTRARHSAVVLGEAEGLECAVRTPGARISGLSERL